MVCNKDKIWTNSCMFGTNGWGKVKFVIGYNGNETAIYSFICTGSPWYFDAVGWARVWIFWIANIQGNLCILDQVSPGTLSSYTNTQCYALSEQCMRNMQIIALVHGSLLDLLWNSHGIKVQSLWTMNYVCNKSNCDEIIIMYFTLQFRIWELCM